VPRLRLITTLLCFWRKITAWHTAFEVLQKFCYESLFCRMIDPSDRWPVGRQSVQRVARIRLPRWSISLQIGPKRNQISITWLEIILVRAAEARKWKGGKIHSFQITEPRCGSEGRNGPLGSTQLFLRPAETIDGNKYRGFPSSRNNIKRYCDQ
jgi:hypothetical protein